MPRLPARLRGPLALAAPVLLVALAHARALARGAWVLKDILQCFYPTKRLIRDRLLEGRVPHWAPELGFGSPMLADPGLPLLYPPNVVLVLPYPWCVTVFLWVHLAIGALGATWLARRLGATWLAAPYAGAAFAAGGYCTSMLGVGVHLVGLAWMPAILAAVDALAARATPWRLAVLAALWASQLASGEAQSALVTGLVAGAWMLAREGEPEAPALRVRAVRLGWLALGVVAAVGLAAAQFFPYLTLFAHNERRGGLSLTEAQHWGLHPARLLELVFPWLFGDLDLSNAEPGSYFAYALDNEGESIDRWPWITTPYVGSVTALLAAAAWGRPRARRAATFFAAVAACAVLVAVGRYTPVFRAFYTLVPLARSFRYPAKYFMATSLALPLLGALGLDALLAGATAARRGVAFAAAALLALGAATFAAAPVLAASVLMLPPPVVPAAADAIRDAVIAGLAVPLFAAVVVALSARAESAFARTCAVSVVALVGAVDVAWNVTHTVPVADARLYEAHPSWVPPELANTRVYWEIGDVDLIGPSSPLARADATHATMDALMPNVPLLFGMSQANYYTMTATDGEKRFWGAARAHLRAMLDVYGVGLVVRDRTEKLAAGEDGLEPIRELPGSGVLALRNTTALPLVYWAGRAIGARDREEAVARLEDPAVRRGEAIVVEGAPAAPGDGAPEPPGARAACSPAPAASGDQLRATCAAARDGWVFFSTADDWGWRATLDGAPAPLTRANGRGLAVRVPAGAHEVRLVYREPAYLLGVVVSLVTFSLLGLAVALSAKARR